MEKYWLIPVKEGESFTKRDVTRSEYFFDIGDDELLVIQHFSEKGRDYVVVPGYVQGRTPDDEHEGVEILDIKPVPRESRDLVNRVLKNKKMIGPINFWS